MRLYHFTSPGAIPSIQANGIAPSYLQLPMIGKSNHQVVSLTGDPDPTCLLYKSLWDDTPLSGNLLEEWQKDNPGNTDVPRPNTIARRIHLEIDENDERLFLLVMPDVKELGFISQEHLDIFMKEGGGEAGMWCIFRGYVPAEFIVDIDETGF